MRAAGAGVLGAWAQASWDHVALAERYRAPQADLQQWRTRGQIFGTSRRWGCAGDKFMHGRGLHYWVFATCVPGAAYLGCVFNLELAIATLRQATLRRHSFAPVARFPGTCNKVSKMGCVTRHHPGLLANLPELVCIRHHGEYPAATSRWPPAAGHCPCRYGGMRLLGGNVHLRLGVGHMHGCAGCGALAVQGLSSARG